MGDMFKYLLFSHDVAFRNVSHRSVKTKHVIFCADWWLGKESLTRIGFHQVIYWVLVNLKALHHILMVAPNFLY